jgi:serine/threonine protein kinase
MNNAKSKYVYESILGEGTFGRVYKVKGRDEKSYAMKVNFGSNSLTGIINPRDLSGAKVCENHPYLLSLIDIIKISEVIDFRIQPPKKDSKKDPRDSKLCPYAFIMPIANFSLNTTWHTSASYQAFAPHTRDIMYQILVGLEYLHSHGIAHRDIKPDNIMIFSSGGGRFNAKIGDHGYQKLMDPFVGNTTKILNYKYRAPEIVLESPDYTTSVDIWSAGIMFFQMLSAGSILINAKRDEPTPLLSAIHNLVSISEITYSNIKYTSVFEAVKQTSSANSLASLIKNGLQKVASISDIEAISLIKRMVDPQINRISATECLRLPFFEKYSNDLSLIRREKNINPKGTCEYPEEYIIVSKSPLRQLVFSSLVDFYEKKSHYYRHQLVFSTMDLFDQWLVWRLEQHSPDPDEEEIQLAFHSALYIFLKLSITYHGSFTTLFPSITDTKKFLEMEEILLFRVSHFKLFRKTLYEELIDFDESEMKVLLRILMYKIPEYNGKSWGWFARSYQKVRKNGRFVKDSDNVTESISN